MLLLTQVDGKFGAVVFNVGTNFIAVAYDDAGKVWEAFPRDELVKRASIALDMPSRDALFYVGMGKADVPMGTKGRPAPASYYRGCVFPFDNNMEMYYSYEPVKCPPSMADVHKTNYGTPPHPEVLACGDGVKCMPPMVVATDAGRNSLAPKVPRVGRLLGHAIIHVPGKMVNTRRQRGCALSGSDHLSESTRRIVLWHSNLWSDARTPWNYFLQPSSGATSWSL